MQVLPHHHLSLKLDLCCLSFCVGPSTLHKSKRRLSCGRHVPIAYYSARAIESLPEKVF
jgi:hypothetical protein